jgi:hypothetical protein
LVLSGAYPLRIRPYFNANSVLLALIGGRIGIIESHCLFVRMDALFVRILCFHFQFAYHTNLIHSVVLSFPPTSLKRCVFSYCSPVNLPTPIGNLQPPNPQSTTIPYHQLAFVKTYSPCKYLRRNDVQLVFSSTYKAYVIAYWHRLLVTLTALISFLTIAYPHRRDHQSAVTG